MKKLLFLVVFLPLCVHASVQKNNLFNKIALCESGNYELAKNPKSSASGRFQFIKSTWKHYGIELWGDTWIERDVFDYNDNSELAYYVFTKYGTGDWLESKYCWNKLAVDG